MHYNLIQWGLTWLSVALMPMALDFYFHNRLHKPALINALICVAFSVPLIFSDRGGYYSQLPASELVHLPWGESIYALNYQGTLTYFYSMVALYALVLPTLFGFYAWQGIRKSGKKAGWIIVIGFGVMTLALIHDVLIDYLPNWSWNPIRLYHITNVILIFAFNLVLFDELRKVKHLQNHVQQQDINLQLLLSSMPGGLFQLKVTHNENTSMVYANAKVGEIMGLQVPMQDLLPQFLIRLQHPDRQAFQDARAQAISASKRFNHMARYPHPDGSIHWLQFYSTPHQNEHDLFYYGLVIDQTVQMNAQRERDQFTQAIQRKNDELESMLYAASHDLRAPLVNILGFSAEMRNDLDALTLDPNDRQDLLLNMNFIESNGKRMDGLLNSMLLVSRTGRLEPKIEDINMRLLIGDLIKDFHHSFQKVGVSIQEAPLPSARGDRQMVVQIFSNLILNALRYCGTNPQLVIGGLADQDFVNFYLKDNGPGIPSNDLQNVFKMFFRVDPANSPGGTGIGLTISLRLAHKMQGAMWVESTPGQGSTFYLRLPRT